MASHDGGLRRWIVKFPIAPASAHPSMLPHPLESVPCGTVNNSLRTRFSMSDGKTTQIEIRRSGVHVCVSVYLRHNPSFQLLAAGAPSPRSDAEVRQRLKLSQPQYHKAAAARALACWSKAGWEETTALTAGPPSHLIRERSRSQCPSPRIHVAAKPPHGSPPKPLEALGRRRLAWPSRRLRAARGLDWSNSCPGLWAGLVTAHLIAHVRDTRPATLRVLRVRHRTDDDSSPLPAGRSGR